MNLEAIKAAVTSKAARQILQTQKHSPKILFAAGVLGVVGATVLACRATISVSDLVLDAEEVVAEKKRLHEKTNGEAYSDSDLKRDLTGVKLKTALEIVKLYAPAVGVGVVSIAALTGSHMILTKRNGAIMAAYAGLDRAYKEYRQRVKDEFGEDADRMLFAGAETTTVSEKMADGTTKTSKIASLTGKFGGSPYAVVFDEKSKHFSREPGRNPNTLMMLQNYANDKLRARGHLFLNEVLDMVDLPRIPAGQIVGWVYKSKNSDQQGDGYVTFGMYDGTEEMIESFLDGHEKIVVLDFNVDGPIYELI